MVLIPTKKITGIGKKFLCGLICFCIFFTQAGFSETAFAAVIDPADSPNNPEVIYDLVAIVIDTELDKDTSSYQGLNDQFPNYLNENTIGERIIRYASDIQKENDLTDVKILFFDKETENVNDLAKALENLHVNGDGTHKNRLTGAVFIGDIPMPVVNKEGNRFMSIFPYVDFYDKAYVYNSETKTYERNTESDFPKPEIWHGIIRAPESGISGMEKLAEYFDKNHLYYSDVPNYSKFDKKIFFGDLVHEEEMMNSDVYQFYLDYLESWEDLAYMRYNKHWANELTGTALEENDISVNLDNPPEYENENFDPEEFSEALENSDLMDQVPDIYSKQIIDKYLLPYYKVFSRYISEVNDFAEWTGRFAPDEKGLNVDSVPTLITIKDEYAKYYLRTVGDALENKINEVIERVQEPLPVIKESRLSGSFDYEGGLESPFKIGTGPGTIENSTNIKYHYEEDGEFYIKGINAGVIETAKQCGVYLGSTKTEYFDENLNYNPKAVDGEYSVLTRAIRSDDPKTAFAVPSVGINTRLLSPTEANILTGYNAGNGALIESNDKYGVSAFTGNTLYEGYLNPVEDSMTEGLESYTPIVITKVNGNLIDAQYTFDQAINESYETVVDVIEKINNNNTEDLDYSSYSIAVKPGESLDQGNISKVVGNFDIEYYRNGQQFKKNFTFTVREDDGNYYIVRDDAEGDPEIIVLLSRTGFPGNLNDFGTDLFDEESDGAIFPLYDTENQGYDISAGCNMNSANKNSDRCFYWMATMPVLDPAGSSALSRVSIPGGETQLLFPENVEKDDFNQNSNIPAVYAEHKNILQFPGGKTGDYYQYEDVDEVIYNSCFMGLPEDIYNDLFNSMNNFISNNGDEPEESPGKSAVWQNIDNITAEDIILNNSEDLLGNVEIVNLKHFSDRYGIFDGIDNDGDGIRDYEWRDLDEDGVYETKWFDFDESSSLYGIPSWNLEEISRKMLSHNSSYTIPQVLPNSPFESDVTLDINVESYEDTEISSMIIHDEPTSYTIMKQLKSMGTLSLPIDDPRYVVFQSAPGSLPNYPAPQPVSEDIDADEILDGLNLSQYYFPGEIQKIEYPNLFKTENFAQLEADLSTLANKMALMPKSYRIFGENADPSNYSVLDIRNEILNNYLLPTVNGLIDHPNDFDLEIAATEKIYDALEWLNFNIDQKHEYVLKNYLNGGKNAFAGDATLVPSYSGYEASFGYEAAYLVLDGNGYSFDMNFNKDIPEETNDAFDPLSPYLEEEDPEFAVDEFAMEEEEEAETENGGGDGLKFVNLDQFLKELNEFLNYFSTTPGFQEACVFADWAKKQNKKEKKGIDIKEENIAKSQEALELDPGTLNITLEKDVIKADGVDQISVKVLGNVSGNDLVSLELDQSENNPVVDLYDNNSKSLSNGEAKFKLISTGNVGTAFISAETDSGITSDTVSVKSVGTSIDFVSYTYFKPEGMDELEAAIEAAEEVDEEVDEEFEEPEEEELEEDIEEELLEGAVEEVAFEETEKETEVEIVEEDMEEITEEDEILEEVITEEVVEVEEEIAEDKIIDEDELIVREVKKQILEKELEGVLSDISEEEEEAEGIPSEIGREEIVEVEEVLEEAEEEAEEPDITVLTSEPVEEEIEEEIEELEEEEDVIEAEKAKEIEKGFEEWEEYFLIKDYYNRFLESELSYLFDSRLVAEVFSDSMIAYLPENEDSKYILNTSDEMTADGESLMMLNVSIADENGILETDKKHTLKFRAEPDLVTFENGNIVETENGVATVYLRAGTVAGPFTVFAEVLDAGGETDTNYPTDAGTELYLSPGEVTDIDIKSDSYVLLANDQSKTTLNFTLNDEFGNVVNDSFAQIALFIGDGNKAYFDEAADSNNQILGTQLSTIEGHASIDLYSNNEAGEVNIIALLLDYELEEEFIEAGENWEEINFSEYTGNSKTFKILDDVSLEVIPDKLNVPADGASIISIKTELRSDDKIVEGYSGPVNFSVINDNFGNFVSLPPEKMANGVLHEANVKFKSSTLAGEPEILVEVPGFVSETLNLKTLPGEPVEIELSSSADTIYSDGIDEVFLEARLLDQYGNLADTDNNTVVSFSTTEATEGFIDFTGAQNALSLDGIATTTVTGGDISGEANIIADSEGLDAGTLALNVTKHISVINEEIEEFSPRALYISLLGGNFGTLSVGNNLSQALLFSGQVQAVSSVTATPNENKRLFGVDGYGKIDVLSDTVEMDAILATDSFPYQKIVFSDYVADEELASVFLVPKESELILVDDEMENFDNEGIYVERISEVDEEIKFNKKEDGIYIDKSGETKVKVDNYGRIYINDPLLEMKVPEEEDNIMTDGFSLIIYDRGEVLAHIFYRQNFINQNGGVQDVISIPYDADLSAYYPGIYLKLNTSSKKYDVVSGFSRASTEEPMGFYMVDTENKIEAVHAPGFSFDSLEDAKNNFGLGFRGNNKHMLLFAGGNSVGESHIPYATDAGIIYGDPTIRLELDGIVGLVSELSGYTKTIGRSLFSGKKEILEIINFDYNGDGMDDILLAYEDGLVRLLENEISNKRFKDRGYILNIDGGIYSTAKIDVNNDGYDDLMVGSKESCLEGEVSISLYTNNGGSFERETLPLDISGKVFEMKSTDMNQDGCDDLVLSDSAGNVRVFYNQNDGSVCTGLEKNFGNTFNFGFSIDGEVNSANNLYINYAGMEQLFEGTAALNYEDSNTDKFISFVLDSDQPPQSDEGGAEFAESASEMQESLLTNENIATKDIPPQTYPKEYNFIHIGEDPRFGIDSTKFGVDENGGNVDVGDKINYVITLENSGAYVNNLILSDLTPVTMTLDVESLECLDVNCTDDLQWEETDNSVRSHVIKNITVPANGKRTLKYSMTVKSVPEVHFDVGNFIESEESEQYPDILVKPEFNPEGVLTYLYSTGLNAQGYSILSKQQEASEGGDALENDYEDQFEDLGLPDFSGLFESINMVKNIIPGQEDEFELPSELEKQTNALVSSQSEDLDYDGMPDSWGGKKDLNFSSAANALANEVENVTSLLRCSGGGCLPIPYNYAFLAPNDAIPGIAAFAAGTPNPPYFGFMLPSTIPSNFRLYTMPTLTMGVGTGICAGPSVGHTSPCFAFAIPMQALGACPNFLGPINDAIASAKDSTSDPDIGMATVVSDGNASTGTDAISGNFAYSDPDSPVSAAGSVNIRIPGFPSVITNWIDKQTDEIYNKLLDLPDFYFIYPDVKTLISEHAIANTNFSEIKNLHDFMSAVNSLPLIQIVGKEVLIKVPAISQAEITKWKRQAQAWIRYEEEQLDRLVEYWSCDENEHRKTLCDKVMLDTNELIQSVKKLMDKLDIIANLPREVLTWRNLESKYANQIICYLDAVMQFTGGYMRKQQKTVEAWMKAVEDVIRTFKDWKLILDLMVEYQASCDQCKNDRFSKLGLLMQLFVAIPDPPIIPLPKWPDIIFDISQIQTGVKIIWPDLVFKPEPVILPNLPYITFPEIPLPDLIIELPGFDIPDWIMDFPTFIMPNLPDLPPLPIPDLPDLPRPPKIPKLPNLIADLIANLKPIFKILCLLKNGLVPVPEASLATEVETLTQPTVQAVLPIIKNLGMQMPAIQYDYVEQIRVNAKMNFGIDTSFIYAIVREGAEKMNKRVEELINNINKYTGLPWQRVIDNIINKALEEVEESITENLEDTEESVQGTVDETTSSESAASAYEDEVNFYGIKNNIEKFSSIINEYSNKYAEEIKNYENYPDSYYLTADQIYLDTSDPVLNRSIEEIEFSIQNEDLPDTAGMKQLASLRNALIDYSKGLKKSNYILSEIEDYNSLSDFLVETDQSIDKFASLAFQGESLDSNNSKNTIKTDFFGEGVKESLLAAKVDIDPETALDTGEVPAEAPTGFYVIVEDQNENVLNYTEELGKTVHTLFSDVDGDGDHDIIYSLGGDVYIKENHKFDIELPKGEVIISATKGSVSDYAKMESVQAVGTVYQGHEQIDISWNYQENSIGYEVIIRKSLMDDEDDAVYQDEIDDPQKTTLSVEIENGNYYVTVYAIDENGNRSTASSFAVAEPQACADNDPPFPAVTKTEYDLPVFKQLEIDASGSFDPSGEITDYSLENIPYSKEGEGKFMIGPFINEGDLGLHEAILNIVDQSNNSSAMNLGINVFAPDIKLNDTFGRTSVATGSTDPMIDNLPFSLMRNRYIYRVVDGELKMVPRIDKVVTESAFDNGKYYTDDGGEYEISDFNLEDMILVENENGETVAEINPGTGNIGALADDYSTVANSSSPPLSPGNVNIIDENGDILGTVYAVSDPNIDVKVNEDVGNEGVFANDTDLNDSFELMSFPADHPGYPGGAALVYINENKQMAAIDTSGNILLLDIRMTMRQKKNDHKKDPLAFELLFEGKVVCEVHIKAGFRDVQILGPDDVPFTTPRPPSASVFYSPSGIIGKKLFTDVDEELNRIVSDLFAKDIIEAVKTDEGLVVNPDKIVSRAEYVKTMLNMLCIIPRPEAYEPYAPGEAEGGYSDIIYDSDNPPWYYPYIKEADLLGLVYGYRGDIDPETGLPPFRPEAPITRAEAVNIILEALEYKGIIDLSELSIGDPWYIPFMEAAQDLTPYVVGQQYIKNNFIITPEEAQSPEKEMTREELIIMSSRVLDFYNCFEIDQDNDDMSDFCEKKYNISDPQNDVDDDGVININECYYGLDPKDRDTDGGGMTDGKELEFGTDPLDPTDDPEDDDNDGLTNMAEILIHNTNPDEADTDQGGVNDGDEVDNLTDPLNAEDDFEDPGEYKTGESGYYIVPAECSSCPCLSTFLHSADIIPGDIFFTVISTYDESYIFSKSNEVIINSVNK